MSSESWTDLVMHHANQMLAYTPPEEVELRQQIMQAQNLLAKMKSKARKPPPPPKVKPRKDTFTDAMREHAKEVVKREMNL